MVLMVAILAAFILPVPVRAGGSSIISVCEGVTVAQGASFEVPISATAPIYGASLEIQTISGFETSAPPAFGGMWSTSAGVAAESDPSRSDMVYFVFGSAEPKDGCIATLRWVAGDAGSFGFRISGYATDADMAVRVGIEVLFVVNVRLFRDMDGNGVVDTDDAMSLAEGIVGLGGQPRWTAGSHPIQLRTWTVMTAWTTWTWPTCCVRFSVCPRSMGRPARLPPPAPTRRRSSPTPERRWQTSRVAKDLSRTSCGR